MFESTVHAPEELRTLGDAALVDAITASARTAAAVQAHHLAAIAELARRRLAGAQHPRWACDDWDSAAAEIGCALTIKHGRALSLMERARTLADELPKVGALFLAGRISAPTAMTIVARTTLITDPDARAEVDAEIAAKVTRWGPLSQLKLETTIDAIIDTVDPDAVRRTQRTRIDRQITIGDPRNDDNDLSTIWGRISAVDAALLDETLTAMAKNVCDDDPRTLAQRRADALGALAAHADRLVCACDNPTCPAKTGTHPAAHVTIHIVTNHIVTNAPVNTVPGPAPAAPGARPTAVIPGRGFVSAETVADLITHGATIRRVATPTAADPERRYRPSARLDEFVRTRDLTCRWPGCERPATKSDIDHSNPWDDGGHTHPSALNDKCRLHHLLRTFWDDWTEVQHPDGRITITSPTGHSYTSAPFSRVLFPGWDTNTGPAPPPGKPRRKRRSGRTLMMPARKQPRANSRARRIAAERARNHAAILAEDPGRFDPPPF
ncbi:HNH endonuclease signature motif containing protein [Mycolicibacterium fallax]|uniref:DUF222 domain-containing protein n=1 Tax=Mycolicibacterium fallax TaxID=1793 RepID=A0A1X1RI05_MYCFA|nr:HNH endonuclease signature motif containing protein [Mycolicibacterium fallax]ORV06651.1 hypothetical protein AWC04_04115 [Mycolicibacterium fallax]BBY96596.1 HNH endonuclease [Mycolicibacterium fallax]HOW94004.1 DUF222 domain-containing protein [Mycolicibacterium fallax]